MLISLTFAAFYQHCGFFFFFFFFWSVPTKVPLNGALNHQLLRVARWPINKEPVRTGQLPVVGARSLWECAPQLHSIDECRISSIVECEPLNCGALPLIWEALCARLGSDSDLQPIRIKGADNWRSPFCFSSAVHYPNHVGAPSEANAHMCAISVYVCVCFSASLYCFGVLECRRGGGGAVLLNVP